MSATWVDTGKIWVNMAAAIYVERRKNGGVDVAFPVVYDGDIAVVALDPEEAVSVRRYLRENGERLVPPAPKFDLQAGPDLAGDPPA